MTLPRSTFLTAITSLPIISFDLIIRNQKEQVLLGLRSNQPAQGYWFVPGGRILKDERLQDAFLRVSENELGKSFPLSEGKFLGVFQHFYTDNFANTDGVSTHYIVLGVEIMIDEMPMQKPFDQHREWQWWTIQDLISSPMVHPFTKAYFDQTQATRVF
ncbi:MAG: GDP-mannose mannosyl hydrolase [Anaerolineaceae bacterium]